MGEDKMEMGLLGKRSLVLGSSKGLGRAIAESLAKEGADVLITSRNEENLKETKEEIEKVTKGRVYYFATDLSKKEGMEALYNEVQMKLGGLDILVNNSGGPSGGEFEQFSDEDWQQAFELTLLSYIRSTRLALPMLKKNGGKIINITSTSVKQPIPGLILSNTFRLGIVGLTKSIAEEFAPYNILVNAVAPGSIETDRIKELNKLRANKLNITSEEVESRTKQQIPLKRYGAPEEFAKVVTFLASDANSYMTGSTLLVDGGMVRAI
jgi:3-oxoacyl-[acyl-carrier protein] reductase